jgi:hypothetical protein
MTDPPDGPATLTDDEIETRRFESPAAAATHDTGDPTDATDTGDDAGDPTDAADTGDDSGDAADTSDTGDDA